MKNTKLFSLAMITCLIGCGSDTNRSEAPSQGTPGMPEDSAPGTQIVKLGQTLYTVPEYTFLNEPFEYTKLVGGAEQTLTGKFSHFSETAPDDCCELRLYSSVDAEWHSIAIPSYAEVLYLGPPLTLPDGRSHTIKLSLNNQFLDAKMDAVATISWQQTSGLTDFEVTDDDSTLTFDTPLISEIERWVFKAKVTTEHGRVFEQEKIVFVIPEKDWLAVTQLYEGASGHVALRENNTYYAGENNGLRPGVFSQPLDQTVKLIASSGNWVFVIDEDSQLTNYDRFGEAHQVAKDFGNITEMLRVESVRSTTLIVNDLGNVYSSINNYDIKLMNAVSVVPSLFEGPYLNTTGSIVDENGKSLVDDVKQLSITAYLTANGSIGALDASEEADLSVFKQYSDYIRVTSSKVDWGGNNNNFIFALRSNGSVVSTTRLPPALANIITLSSGQDIHTALHQGGWLYRWRSSLYLEDDDEIFIGLLPNPMNLTPEAFKKYQLSLGSNVID